jgi:threonine dehydrogenase-like Zn-dependent dehydrogenase
MVSKYEIYQEGKASLPQQVWAWNLYGAGIENIGQDGHPEKFDLIQEPNDDQLLVRIDSVGLCFSDLKVIKLGREHPKLYNRDLTKEPTRLGHEVSLTIMKVGKNLKDHYFPGQRLAVQPDIYQKGKSTAYGYTIPGGLIQYHLIGPEVLETDEGECLLPVKNEKMSYAGASLLEPWGCVMAAYTQRRRLEPLKGGVMWILGQLGDSTEYQFSSDLNDPATIILTDVPASVAALARNSGARIEERNNIHADNYKSLSEEFTGGKGFDDIIVLAPRSAKSVSAAARLIARRGIMNVVGNEPLDDLADVDLGRLHYDYISFVGNSNSDISASYGEQRNRCELYPQGVALFVGAGGPMGQMHVQRAIELPNGPKKIIATELNDERLAALRDRFLPLAEKNKRELILFNPQNASRTLKDLVMELSNGKGADDVVVCVPVAKLMAESAAMMSPNGMLVLFAGVPNGTMAALDLSPVYLHNVQYTGTSGLTLQDQKLVLDRSAAGSLSPELSVAAIGGMNSARDGLSALMEGRYPGKIIIFPQMEDLPLLSLSELKIKIPEVGAKLGPGDAWTLEAEAELFERFWNPDK